MIDKRTATYRIHLALRAMRKTQDQETICELVDFVCEHYMDGASTDTLLAEMFPREPQVMT